MPKQDIPDIKTFLSDPAFQKDRDFFFALFDAYNAHKAEEERKRKEQEEPESVFDRFFGGTSK